MRRAIIMTACTALAALVLISCGQSSDSFVGTWHGLSGESSLTMRIERTGDGTYAMTTTSYGTVPMKLSGGALVGTASDGADMTFDVRISSTGADTLHAAMRAYSGTKEAGTTTVDWLRDGAATPAALADKYVPSEADLAYMHKLSKGMALSAASVNATSAAWKQGMLTETGVSKAVYRQLMKGWRLMQKMADEWSPFPQPPSEELKPLMRKCGTAMSDGGHYVVESSKVFSKMSAGTVPSSKSTDRMLAWYDKWRKAIKAAKAEYRRIMTGQ